MPHSQTGACEANLFLIRDDLIVSQTISYAVRPGSAPEKT